MRNAKPFLSATILAAGLAGAAVLTKPAPNAGAAPVAGPANPWRYFDGHWSYWDAADQR